MSGGPEILARQASRGERGLTLVEMLLVVFILAAIAATATELVGNIDDQTRYHDTRERLQTLRAAPARPRGRLDRGREVASQAKLLRFLAERELSSVGAGARVAVDVRVIAATNRSLEDAVRDGLFRGDLYYRLSVFTIRMPPLRERREDLPALVARFLGNGARGELSKEALEALARHDWPGNVRELRNVVEHGAVVARGALIGPEHLPQGLFAGLLPRGTPPQYPRAAADLSALAARFIDEARAAGLAPSRAAADRVDRAMLQEALRREGGSISGTARLLGLSRVTVRKRMRELGVRGAAEERPPQRD